MAQRTTKRKPQRWTARRRARAWRAWARSVTRRWRVGELVEENYYHPDMARQIAAQLVGGRMA